MYVRMYIYFGKQDVYIHNNYVYFAFTVESLLIIFLFFFSDKIRIHGWFSLKPIYLGALPQFLICALICSI